MVDLHSGHFIRLSIASGISLHWKTSDLTKDHLYSRLRSLFQVASVFSSIASSPDPHVEEDGEDDEDPNADRDPNHLNIIIIISVHN